MDFYKQGEEFVVTREQIGRALGYENPNKAIANIHDKHADRFKGKCSFLTLRNQIKDRWGGEYERKQEVYVYNRRGMMEICRWSSKPKADSFMDWAFEKIDALMRNGVVAITDNNVEPYKMMLEYMKGQEQFQMKLLNHLDRQEQRIHILINELVKTHKLQQPQQVQPASRPKYGEEPVYLIKTQLAAELNLNKKEKRVIILSCVPKL